MREDILARGEDPSSFPILNDIPEIDRDLIWIWEAYMVLTNSRQFGMSSPQPIQMSEVLAYATYSGYYHPEDRELLLHHVQKLDQVFQADFRARNPNPGGKP